MASTPYRVTPDGAEPEDGRPMLGLSLLPMSLPGLRPRAPWRHDGASPPRLFDGAPAEPPAQLAQLADPGCFSLVVLAVGRSLGGPSAWLSPKRPPPVPRHRR